MLSEKKKAFCIEYVIDFNGAAAAIRAGYSKRRARITASEILTDPEVGVEIASLIEARNVKAEDAAARVIKELEHIAYAKTTDFVKVKEMFIGRGKKRHKVRVVYAELTNDVEEEKQKAISEIKQTKDGIGIKAHDKVGALRLLGQHYGIFVEKHEHTGKDGKPIELHKSITHNINFKKFDK